MNRISVIMGIYNCADTLPEALDSLLTQTYQDFKVIMCDDGSTDNTYEVAQSYVERFPDKFILLRNETNKKLAATLNHCLEFVDTEYVARMDGDDISLPERFETQIKFLDDHPEYSHVSCTMKLFDENGIYGVTSLSAFKPTSSQFKWSVPYCHAPTIFRKSTLDAIGGYNEEQRVERFEDYYLWYKIHKAGMQGYNLDVPLYSMRNDAKAFARRKFKDRLRVFYVKREVLRNLDVKFGLIYCLIDISKGLVPPMIIRLIRKKIILKRK